MGIDEFAFGWRVGRENRQAKVETLLTPTSEGEMSAKGKEETLDWAITELTKNKIGLLGFPRTRYCTVANNPAMNIPGLVSFFIELRV